MANYEVFIPAKDQDSLNVTITVEAPNWIGALRAGLAKIGEGQEAIANIMCDIKPDNSIHVTDTVSGRLFRLHEVAEDHKSAKTVVGMPAVSVPPVAPPDTAPVAKPAPAAGRTVVDMQAAAAVAPVAPPAGQTVPAMPPVAPPATGAMAKPAPVSAPRPGTQPVDSADIHEARTAAMPAAPRTRPQAGERVPTRNTPQFKDPPAAVAESTSKPAATDPQLAAAPARPEIDVDSAIADVFDATQDLWMQTGLTEQKIADAMLEIAMGIVKAESGTFYLSSVNDTNLTFAAVKGPKAAAIAGGDFKVPVGTGVVGFSAQEGVALAIHDMKNDARHLKSMADAIGYQPDNTACAPAEQNGRLYGAVQLINKDGGFTPGEIEVLRYVGLTAADMLAQLVG